MKKDVKVFVLALVALFGLEIVQNFRIGSKCYAQLSVCKFPNPQFLNTVRDDIRLGLINVNYGNAAAAINAIDRALNRLSSLGNQGGAFQANQLKRVINDLRTAKILILSGMKKNIFGIKANLNQALGGLTGI